MGNKLQKYLYSLCCLFLLLQSCSVSKQINKQAHTILLQDSIINTGHIGISIFEPATNTYWYNYDAEKYFVPASNTKLFTLYAGMKYLGDSLVGARYYYTKLQQLHLVPTGDPTFLNSEFSNQPLFDFLKNNKVFWIELELTKQRWKEEKYGKGWAWDDYSESYLAQRSAFPMYCNLAKFYTTQDSIFIQSDTAKYPSPPVYPIKVIPSYFLNLISPDKPGRPLKYQNFTLQRKFDENIFIIKTALKTSRNEVIPFNTDPESIGALLNDTIEKATYSKRAYSIIVSSVKNDSIKLFTIHSQPTDSLLTPMMHNSDNFFAEQTLLMASNEHLGYMNDEAIIDTLLKTDLKDVPQKPNWVDGSGLSRYNLFTPQSFVYILNKMKNEFGLERLKVILPTGGEGTLKNYYNSDSSFIYAKTGSLSSQIALSGFLITKKNKLLVFSILTNNAIGDGWKVRRAYEHFLKGIREKY